MHARKYNDFISNLSRVCIYSGRDLWTGTNWLGEDADFRNFARARNEEEERAIYLYT